ncbi:MAG: ELM1/GtrOC1 family putative glycosyltransferase [Gallionellaceae bacterium]|nr:ELM1/GtrOC1 family putative glycosyltransferase [Gallionellaceae bacterium]
MRPAFSRPLTLWRLLDGKPGHEKQTLGLAQALGRLTDCRCLDIAVPARGVRFLSWLAGRFPAGDGLPAPDLILAAGHATHLAALAARRAHGGRIAVLMKPSLPLAWFDLCLIPEHDAPPARSNALATLGVLNAVTPGGEKVQDDGLFLIGGVSPHYRWDDDEVIRQIRAVIDATPEVHWRLTDSRRTPASFMARLTSATTGTHLEILPHATTPPGWLEQTLSAAGQAWVSEDSVSMVYEALTAGCAVGLIRLPSTHDSRISRGIATLVRDNWLTTFNDWRQNRRLPPPPGRFDEAGRCAEEILKLWFRNAN